MSKLIGLALGIITLALAWLQSFLVRHETTLGSVLIVVAVATAIHASAHSTGRLRAAVVALASVSASAQVLWFLERCYVSWVASQISAIFLALISIAVLWTLGSRPKGARRLLLHLSGGGLVTLAASVSMAVIVVSITPAPLALAVQKGQGYGNTFAAAAPSKSSLVQGGVLLTNDVRYGTQYPNSYLDIYIADGDPTVDRPTLIYVHGGGWIIGSKTMGDPKSGRAAFALGNGPLLQRGYNVVTLDYALAPTYAYPTPLIQLSQAVSYLQKNAERYGLDMNRVIMAGESAGGHIAAQFAAVQTNPAYADEVGIPAVINPLQLKAVSLDSAALDGARASRTQAPDVLSDWAFSLAGRSYLHRAGFLIKSDEMVQQTNIIAHVTAAYPPTFVGDGNYGTFGDQARDLALRLDRLGVRNQLDLPPLSLARLGHGYMNAGPSQFVDTYNAEKLAFLDSVVK